MVGSAVPGLSPTSITVTDQSGRLLTRRVESPEESFEQANEQLIAQEKTESMLAKKAQEMLDMAMGPGRSIVRVNVALDFSKTDKRSEKYDSENRVVRSETIESENTSSPGAGGGGGVAGAVANVPVGNPGVASTDAGGMSKSKKENVRTEYAIPSDVEQVSMRGAKILHLSVSVCVAKSEKPVDKKSIEQLVKNAVGFQEAAPRKDSMEVAEMEFPAVAVPPSVPWWKRMPISLEAIGRVLLGLVVLVVIWLVSKRVLEGGEVRGEEAGVPLGSLAGANRKEMLESIGPGMADRNLGEISSIARQNPKSVAAWISNASNANMPS
jgi:flagellar M-ring protein FliF